MATRKTLLVARHWADVELAGHAPEQERQTLPTSRRGRRFSERPSSSEFVLFAQRDPSEAYSYSSFHYSLQRAEEKAEIAHKPYRGAHGFRKMVVGNVIEATGDRMLGLEYVGDRDPGMLRHYDMRNQERIDKASAALEEKK